MSEQMYPCPGCGKPYSLEDKHEWKVPYLCRTCSMPQPTVDIEVSNGTFAAPHLARESLNRILSKCQELHDNRDYSMYDDSDSHRGNCRCPACKIGDMIEAELRDLE